MTDFSLSAPFIGENHCSLLYVQNGITFFPYGSWFQHLEYSMLNTTVDYYVIGAADVVDPSTKHINDVPTGSLKYHGADILTLGGFAFVQADLKSMNLTFVDAEGTLLYSHAMPPRG